MLQFDWAFPICPTFCRCFTKLAELLRICTEFTSIVMGFQGLYKVRQMALILVFLFLLKCMVVAFPSGGGGEVNVV